ncbi:hypothetical protein JHK85_055460 [Glycine max]|nr:hypothetical protein JHK85_055460 [Glycine max]
MANHSLVLDNNTSVSTVTVAEQPLVIGQEFPDVETCRRTMKDIAIAMHFDLRIVKSDRSRFIAKCSKEGCPWRVHVAKCPGVPTFTVRTLHGEHTCEGVQNLHHQQASVGWVARSVEARIRDNPQYKPREILQDIRVNTDNMPRLTILSERQRGLVEAVETHFPTASHGFCLRYVSENFRDTFKNTKLVNIFWNAVYALTAAEFESKITEMMEISQDVISWFQQFPPYLWAVAYFDSVRYGHFTLGVTELLYNWALECHELPVVQMMEHIRQQMVSWFNDRQDMGMTWTSILVPSAEKRIMEAIADAHCYQVLRANEVEFEIVSTERTNIVDIRSRECSCRRWQLYGLPCAHAAAALISCGHNAHMFAEPCFTVQSYRMTYSQMINPIPDKSQWRDQGEGAEGGGGARVDIIIRPPKTRRPPGRPKKKVLRVENFKRPKRVVQCGRCHMLGHSQKKCTMPI